MALVYSEMLPLGTAAPEFSLPVANPETDGREGDYRTLADFSEAELLLVVFTCNHCPYAIDVEDRVIALAKKFAPRGVATVAISPNDPEAYPADSFEQMTARAAEKQFPFPYLLDERQDVARAYDAACTPDLYVFDQERHLVYRGRIDDGRPGRAPTTADLAEALEQLLSGGDAPGEQHPSMGCSIKWRSA